MNKRQRELATFIINKKTLSVTPEEFEVLFNGFICSSSLLKKKYTPEQHLGHRDHHVD